MWFGGIKMAVFFGIVLCFIMLMFAVGSIFFNLFDSDKRNKKK